jgi:hypothetical protein
VSSRLYRGTTRPLSCALEMRTSDVI